MPEACYPPLDLNMISMSHFDSVDVPFTSAAMRSHKTPTKSAEFTRPFSGERNPARRPASWPSPLSSQSPPSPSSSASQPYLPPPSPPSARQPVLVAGQECLSRLLSAPAANSSCLHLLPPLRHSHSARLEEKRLWNEQDIRIDLPPLLFSSRRDHVKLTNPSVSCFNGRLVLAARAMWDVAVQPPCTDVWRSHTIFTTVAFNPAAKSLELASMSANESDFGKGTQTRSCVVDLTTMTRRWEPSVNTGSDAHTAEAQLETCAQTGIPASIGLGSEDPRLLVYTDADVGSSSLQKKLSISYNIPKLHMDITDRVSVGDCVTFENQRAMGLQLLWPRPSVTHELHWPLSARANDRNWVLFHHQGSLHAVFSVEPHVVLQVSSNGRCDERYRTSNDVFPRRFPDRAIHGGANPLLVTSLSGEPLYFVSVLHTKDRALKYDNYAYTFGADPPFRILSLSRRPLALRGKRVRFVSSLSFLGPVAGVETLVGISYGVDDREARLASVPMRLLLQDMVDVSSLSSDLSQGREEDPAELAARMPHRDAVLSAGSVDQSSWLELPHEMSKVPSARPSADTTDGSRLISHGAVGDRPGHCYLMPDTRFDAPSIKALPAESPRDCCALCSATEHCASFSWAPQTRQCWLKQWSGTAVHRLGYVSGHFDRESICSCQIKTNARLRINSTAVASLQVRSAAGCCAACMQHQSCGAWMWTPAFRRGSPAGPCELYRPPSIDQVMARAGEALFDHTSQDSVAAIVTLKRSVVFVHHHPPQQQLGSDRRLLALITQILRLGWHVSYAGAESFDPGPVRGSGLLEKLGAPLLTPIKDAGKLVDFVRAQDASVVVMSLWFWGSEPLPARYLRVLRTRLPHVKLVVLSDDVHHKRLKLAAQDEGRRPGKDVGRTKEEELKSYFHADHVLTISDMDKATILASLPRERSMQEERFTTLRHVYADGVLFPLEQRAPFESRHGLVFLGNLNNPTNLFGLRWFVNEVWPIIRALDARVTLRVVGDLDGDYARHQGLPQLLRETAGVLTTGFVPDAELGKEIQKARVFVVPIRWATGILTKQTLAHVHGLPAVLTPTAATHVAPAPLDHTGRGDAWNHELGRYEPVPVALVAAEKAEFAAAVMQLHRNLTLWEELSYGAARYARSGGSGKGVCPTGVGEDWLGFWSKLQVGTCNGHFE